MNELDSNVAPPDGPGGLRVGIVIAAAILLLLSAFFLHQPLKPEEVPPWNPLIMGYTVVMFFPAAALVLCAFVLTLISTSATREAMRRRLRKFLAVAISSVICLVLLDLVLSAFPRLQSSFVDKSLFLPGSDLQVTDAELGYRLKPDLRRSENFEPWRTGNLIMDGQVVAPSPTGEDAMKMELRTDSAGFCNDAVPEKCDIVATGDSFVGQSPVPRDDYWSTLAAKKSDMSLYNLGVGGYGPQQELGVLQKYGLPKKPTVVLWAHFEGNDLRDAEKFAEYQKSRLDWLQFNGVSNMQFPYTRPVVRLLLFIVKALSPAGPKASPLPAYPKPYEMSAGGTERPISFDRWAFRTFTMSKAQIKSSDGWAATTAALLEAKKACDERGAKFVVVYLPDKFTVFADEALARFQGEKEMIFDFAKPALDDAVLKKIDGTEITPEEFIQILRRNYGAQNEAMREFCAREGIPFIDTTPPLRESVKSGKWPYYSYDTHINITGEAVVADTVAAQLIDN